MLDWSRLGLQDPFDSMTRRNRALVSHISLGLSMEPMPSRGSTEGPADLLKAAFTALSRWGPSEGHLTLKINISWPREEARRLFLCLTFPSAGDARSLTTPADGDAHDDRSLQHILAPFDFWPTDSERVGPAEDRDRSWWEAVPLVPAVTSVLLPQYIRRTWSPRVMADMLSRFSRLEELYFETCFLNERIQDRSDSQHLFQSLGGDHRLKKLVVYGNWDEWRNGRGAHEKANPALSREIVQATLNLEHFAAGYVIDAHNFFRSIDASWEWPNLTSLLLVSATFLQPGSKLDQLDTQVLVNDQVHGLLQAAAAAALKMPRLETMEIWISSVMHMGYFRYQVSREKRECQISWRGEWQVTMGVSVIQPWEALMQHRYGDHWTLKVVQEQPISSHMHRASSIEVMQQFPGSRSSWA
ncbi:hypothetical protein QBC34DRAFT_466050 [Podospora aff. communis PSN243]|uniref:DUF6546 domain-containing protein n=1 Tax=Podospora aff. communis PSN243 TaxID=3040156 RepID=A0AAV9GI84_9PEZI|nr:hypothetical protein QBC34DRAFT_466050 [Podospora aff. communis PSN243]